LSSKNIKTVSWGNTLKTINTLFQGSRSKIMYNWKTFNSSLNKRISTRWSTLLRNTKKRRSTSVPDKEETSSSSNVSSINYTRSKTDQLRSTKLSPSKLSVRIWNGSGMLTKTSIRRCSDKMPLKISRLITILREPSSEDRTVTQPRWLVVLTSV
jgi:hypothetical protein